MLDFPELEERRPFTDAEQQAIDDLKELFKNKSDINFQTDDYFLTKFLRYRDWNAKAAYDSVVLYYKLKVKMAHLNANAILKTVFHYFINGQCIKRDIYVKFLAVFCASNHNSI